MKRFVSIAAVLLLSVSGFVFAQGGKEEPKPAAPVQGGMQIEGKLTIAAAANISALADPLKAAFIAKNPKISVDFVFGASGALTTQIKNGAPFQVFMSADTGFPKKLAEEGFASSPAQVYATGALILLSAAPRDFKDGLAALKDASVEKFAMANPETAPYGKAALEALTAAGLWETVKAKAVTAQSITQAVQYTLTAAGIGFVNKSALYTKDLAAYADKEGTNWIAVDPSTHAAIEQAFIVLKSAASDPAAKAFAAFLSSEEAKALFVKYGYAVPK